MNILSGDYKHMRFNRYMVECESEYGGGYRGTNSVLIDTWWNVNHIKMIFYTILICFNRYMVECEYLNPSVVW